MDNVNIIVSETNDNILVLPLSPTSLVSSSIHRIDLEAFDLDEALAEADESRRLFAASKTVVSNLPAVHDVADDDVCSVCMERFDHHNCDEENKRVPCGHVYHSNCITLWLSHCNSCPLCRRQISLDFQCN